MSLPHTAWCLDVTQPLPTERRETVSLADAAVRALQNNLDISISRQNRESRLADIIIEQSKFDPNLSINGQYNRTVNPSIVPSSEEPIQISLVRSLPSINETIH